MNVFEAVKQSVTTRQAAEHYGIRIGRNGMACCPFHHDKTPSMKLDRRYHCFGCGADGDVIDFTAALYGLGKKEAAIQIAQDFGLSYKSVAFVWLKKNKKADSWFYGLGFWTRANAEICLLATKGHPKRQAADIHQFIISPIEAHSKKPDETRDKIVALMGDLPRVELFARQTSPGWDVWGNEVEPTIPDFGTNCPEV